MAMESPTERTTLPLGPNANYQVRDVVIHRKYKGQFDENLVKWTRVENKGKDGQEEKDAEENACKYYLIWMRRDEMEACCPHLLSLDSKATPGAEDTSGMGGADAEDALQKPGETEGDDSFREMVDDINTLVGRAQRMRQRKGQKRGGVGSKMLSNTINILSAYAKIGPLANTFRESGALDLLLSLLSSYDHDVRHSASDMLRSLATFDSASRAYVLLQLTRSDEAAKSTVQSRQMLLDLFAETASSEESELLLSGISLPQVPGRFIFSLLKKYLRVTSLTRNDTTSTPLPEINRNLEDVPEASEFELFHATYQLITELFAVFNWLEGTLDEGVQKGTNRQLRGVSIFTGTKPTEEVTAIVKKKKKNPFKIRDDFSSDRDYGQYVKATLTAGMRVRARVNYESVSGGDYGVYKQTNDGTPPAQFTWDGLGGDTYWVYWHQVEIIPPASETSEELADPIGAAFKKPVKQPYVMKSLAVGSEGERSHEAVDQLFWWEVLSIIKLLPSDHLDAIIPLLSDPRLKTFDDLIHFTPSFVQVAEVTQYLETAYPYLVQEPLSIKELGQFRAVYKEDSFQQVIGSLKVEDPSLDDIEGPYKKEPPRPDPFMDEEPVRVPLMPDDFPSLEDTPLSLIRTLSGLMRHRREEADPELHLRSMEHLHDGSLTQVLATKEVVEKYLEKHPDKCRIATYCLRALKSGVESLTSESDRCECCVMGFFTLFLKLMHVNPESCTLQCAGMECFFKLMGGFGIHDSLPNPTPGSSGTRAGPLTDSTKSLIITTLLSLASATEYGGLKAVADALRCIVDQYNLKMNALLKKNCVMGVRAGLYVLATILTDPDTQQKTDGWGIPAILDAVQKTFPDFASKNDFCTRIAMAVPGYTELPEDLDVGLENPTLDTSSPQVKAITREIMIVIKLLRSTDDIYSKNPLPRLLKLMDRDLSINTKLFLTPRNAFPTLFLLHQGVFYLTQAMGANRSSSFTENALVLLGSLVLVGEEEAAQIVLQGGLKAIINCMNVFPGNKQIQRLCLMVLQALSKDPDHVVIMTSENIATPLRTVKDKYSSDDEIYRMVSRLQEKCGSEQASRAQLQQKILGIIFSGVLQLILSSIEDARRSRTLVNVPKFSAFIKYLSAGSGGGVNLGEKDQCFEKIEVSSNTHRRDRMLDDDPSTYWESSGRAGTHWVRLFMKPGLVIRKLTMDVNSSDSSYMPQRVTIQGGNTPDNVQDVSTVYIPTGFTGAYELITNAKKHYPVIVIRIKRCQQVGGIDARIRGLRCQAACPSLWPIFGDLFSARTKLFYHIQVKTWLGDRSLGPLQLFDRLSAVILHEQTFADHFLVTPTSRHCLGQACRSALITPLISTLTKTVDSTLPVTVDSGGPNFHALIHEYITQMPVPPISHFPWRNLATANEHDRDTDLNSMPGDAFNSSRSQLQLVQVSRIRRMCRLLVDCDNSKITKPTKQSIEEEAEDVIGQSAPSPVVATGAGTIEMAKCWRRVVHSEVVQMLNRFDYTDSPHTIAAELLTLYTQMKQAMMELFGGHSQFALALKKGFSEAFQSLDEVTGVRFCELLCLCIDSLMDTAGKDTTRFQHIGEHQREAMLLNFAEPLQFLHNLDLAHVFEHYYRRHLSARLLRGRSLSLPLEKRLVQVFAHCFPHKHPLQMLQDLDDSMLVMDRFLDSELLESLDQLMVHAGTQQLAPEILELAQKCSFYRQRILHVYILNPCFWPLRQRPMPPLATLPRPLSTFCEDYQRYFTAVHVFGLRQHEKARRLYWTLHGWASMGHSGTKLLVSTVQMIVLLQFNNGELHSLRSLHEATRLSYHELCDALLALTAERQCILIASQAPSQEAAVDDDVYLQSTPFRTNTTFRVNAAFPSDVTKKQKSNKVRFHDVRLVSKSHGNLPSREERTMDLAHVFERRRAIMDSAIIRILKKEREMSVDNIAVKVISGCSAGRFDKGATFGRFNCDFRDVCARVDRLIVDGYIKRDATNQQMLNYVPDPNTEKEEEEGEKEEEQLESVAEPGATEEKVEEPTPKAKDKDTPTASHTPDLTTPTSPLVSSSSGTTSKLLPRKRSSMSRPTLGKMKRKQQFTRLYSNEMYDRDEAPLLGMLPTSRSLTVEEVQQQINSILDSIAQILRADTNVLEHLLHHCQWNKDTLIQRYLNDSALLLQEAGLDGSPSQTAPPSDPQISCPVCLQSVPQVETIALWCGHACCKTCWQRHLSAQLDLNQALVCSCPIGGCHARPTRNFFIELFGAESDTVGKYIKAVVRSYVERSGRLTWCRNPQGCDQVLCRGDGMDTGTCLKCHWSSCFSCHFIEAHQPVSCEDMSKWVEAGGFYEGMDEDARSKQLANLIAKKCPGCNAHIEKNEGCLHMKCKCGYDFCWKCLRSWRPSHTDFYECSAKVSKAAADQKKFVDYNERVTSQQKSKMFAERLCELVRGIGESVPMKTLSFVSDACDLLVQCQKMLSYASVSEYFSQPDDSAYLSFLSEDLEGDTNALQAFLENTLLLVSDVVQALHTLPERNLMDGYRLVNKIESTREKLLLGFHQRFKLGEAPTLDAVAEEAEPKSSKLPLPFVSSPGLLSSPNEYDEDDDDEDHFTDDEEELEDDDFDDDLSYVYSDYDDSLPSMYDDPYDSDMFPF